MAGGLDWVPCVNYGGGYIIDAFTSTANPLVYDDNILVRPSDPGSPTGAVGQAEPEQRLYVKRVIGQVILTASILEGFSIIVYERIRVALWDNDTETPVGWTVSPESADGANEGLLWERHTRFRDGESNNEALGCHPWWSVIDVKSQRRLDRQTCLVYSVAALSTGGETPGSVIVNPFLRTLVR